MAKRETRLKTRASTVVPGHGIRRPYPVTLVEDDNDKLGPKIVIETAGGWYVSTLRGTDRPSGRPVGDRLFLDFGAGWFCDNIQDVLAEVAAILPPPPETPLEYLLSEVNMLLTTTGSIFIRDDYSRLTLINISKAASKLREARDAYLASTKKET